MRYPAEVESLARSYTEKAIKVLAGIMMEETAPHRARVAAAIAILDRGWGKPKEIHEAPDGRRLEKIVHEIVYMPPIDTAGDARPPELTWNGNGNGRNGGHA